jgi:pimeloyl-ACP methyl ester carboxylesterase
MNAQRRCGPGRSYGGRVSRTGDVRRARLRTGITVSWVASGDPAGVPVVLLHAWTESRRSFDRLRAALPPSVNALAVDQRGHGDADCPAGGYSLRGSAEDVVAFLDAVGLARAVLLGSSSGGYVAQQVAVDHPARVAGLVLVGAPRSLHGRPPFADEVDRLHDPVDPAWVRASLSWFPLVQPVPAWYLEDRVADGARVPAHVWRASLHGLTDAVPPTASGPVPVPALVLWGAEDDLLPRAEQEALCAALPGSRFLALPATGHLVLWEQPERVAAELTAFVHGLPRSD